MHGWWGCVSLLAHGLIHIFHTWCICTGHIFGTCFVLTSKTTAWPSHSALSSPKHNGNTSTSLQTLLQSLFPVLCLWTAARRFFVNTLFCLRAMTLDLEVLIVMFADRLVTAKWSYLAVHSLALLLFSNCLLPQLISCDCLSLLLFAPFCRCLHCK